MTAIDIGRVRRAIQQKGAKWTAGENPISRLPADRRARLVSQTPFGPVVAARPLPRPLPPPPSRFDWCDVGGVSYVTPVKEMVGGRCTEFASTAALESCVLRTCLPQGLDLDLAEHAIIESPDGCGGNLHGIAGFLKATGLPSEKWFPADQASAHPGWRAETYRLAEWDCFYPTSVKDVMSLLVNNGPVVTTMNCPDDFFGYAGGIYSDVSGVHTKAFHAILLVGFDTDQQCFKAKNSWGADWGEGGFFRIAFSEFRSAIVNFGWDIHTYPTAFGPEHRQFALQTVNGQFLTAVNGGGLGGPNSGPRSVALHTDARVAGPWETFGVEWLDEGHQKLALRTVNGQYLTAVNGGGIGGPNDGTCPIHTDATALGPWERLWFRYDRATRTATLQTLNGQYLTAVNGGGFGGPNDTPLHTDARAIGPWERFQLVPWM